MTTDELRRRLAEIQDELLATPDDDFSSRHRLRSEQDRLRDQLRDQAEAMDAERPRSELEAKLAALRERLRAIDKDRIDLVSQSGGAGGGTGGGYAPAEIGLNRSIADAQGAEAIKARMAKLEQLLDR